jgi:hypothetical protein
VVHFGRSLSVALNDYSPNDEPLIDRGWMPEEGLWRDPVTGNLYTLQEAKAIAADRESE